MRHFAIAAIAVLNSAVVKPELVEIPVKHPMTLYHLNGRTVTFVVCNKTLAKPLHQALSCLINLKEPVDLVYHGCYNHRYIAGTNRLSNHASGTAIDLNADTEIPARMVKCFEDAGFSWGGRWPEPDTDPMHFEIPINNTGVSYE